MTVQPRSMFEEIIPTETKTQIFGYLNLQDLNSVSLTCTNLNACVPRVWEARLKSVARIWNEFVNSDLCNGIFLKKKAFNSISHEISKLADNPQEIKMKVIQLKELLSEFIMSLNKEDGVKLYFEFKKLPGGLGFQNQFALKDVDFDSIKFKSNIAIKNFIENNPRIKLNDFKISNNNFNLDALIQEAWKNISPSGSTDK